MCIRDRVSIRDPSTEDSEYENHFASNTVRNEDGRFVVSLPHRSDKSHLGDSLCGAIGRFQSLELKFKQNPALHKDYSAFMHVYLNLGHMSLLNAYDLSLDKSDTFYLPHHSVFKGSSITTKLRVVFDGSAKTTNNLSLKDTLMVGPTAVSYTHLDVYKRQIFYI